MSTASIIRRTLLTITAGAAVIGSFATPAAAALPDDDLGTDPAGPGAPDLRVSAASVTPFSATE